MTTQINETRSIAAICNGTVIDHIPAGRGMRIFKLLQLDEYKHCVTIGLNLPSHMGKKDLIKLEGHELTEEESSRVAILAPETTVSIIREWEVVKKFQVSLPSQIQNMIVCPNPRCITNHEKTTRQYSVSLMGKTIYFTCRYCEQTYAQHEINTYKV